MTSEFTPYYEWINGFAGSGKTTLCRQRMMDDPLYSEMVTLASVL